MSRFSLRMLAVALLILSAALAGILEWRRWAIEAKRSDLDYRKHGQGIQMQRLLPNR